MTGAKEDVMSSRWGKKRSLAHVRKYYKVACKARIVFLKRWMSVAKRFGKQRGLGETDQKLLDNWVNALTLALAKVEKANKLKWC